MKAQHNTFSYLPIMQWWLRPFVFLFRCQEQLVCTDYIDIRVRFHKGTIYVCHGCARYFPLCEKNIRKHCCRIPQHARVICNSQITSEQYSQLELLLVYIFPSCDLIANNGGRKIRDGICYDASIEEPIHNYWRWSWKQPIPIPKLWNRYYNPIEVNSDAVILEDFVSANK